MEQRIRILHVAQAAGGVDRYLRMLFKYMDHRCFENILVCSRDFNQADYAGLADGFEHIDMKRSIGVSDISSVKEVRRLIRKYHPDIVYGHSSKAGALSRLANIGTKRICIYNPHGWAFNMECGIMKQTVYAAIERMLSPFCEKIICISGHEKQAALENKICREDKLEVILNGVDIEAYKSRKKSGSRSVSRESCGIPMDAFVVGMVGRICPQKAPDTFIKAAKKIREKIPNSYFLIVGDGELRCELERYAKENGIADSLKITGWVENALDYVDLFNVALLLSRWEGFGLAIPEYMMAGKPVVASKVGAIPGIITDREDGLLVEVDDVNQIVGSVESIHDNQRIQIQLRNNGIMTVHDKFDVTRTVRESEALFLSLAKSGDVAVGGGGGLRNYTYCIGKFTDFKLGFPIYAHYA